MTAYLDSSAAAKLLIREPESDALAAWLTSFQANGGTVVSSMLLETELRRFASRVGAAQTQVTTLLTSVDLAEMPPSLFREAGLLPGANLRSLDALHLAMAARANASVVLTYDARMAAAAETVGLAVLAPV